MGYSGVNDSIFDAKAACSGLLEHVTDGVYIVDTERKIRYWNRSAERITGFKASEMLGMCCCDSGLLHIDAIGQDQCNDRCPLASGITTGETKYLDLFILHKKGHRVPVSVKVIPLHNEQGELSGALEVFSDNSFKNESLKRIEELKKLVLFDYLTQTGNRHFVEMNLATRLAEFARYAMPFGVLFIDFDDFKHVNDTYGHAVGDEVLKVASRTIVKNIRPYDILGRWGGEEFVLILVHVPENAIIKIAEKLRVLIAQSGVMVQGKSVAITVSIGATFALKNDTYDSIIQRADHLMYQSKSKGINTVTLG